MATPSLDTKLTVEAVVAFFASACGYNLFTSTTAEVRFGPTVSLQNAGVRAWAKPRRTPSPHRGSRHVDRHPSSLSLF